MGWGSNISKLIKSDVVDLLDDSGKPYRCLRESKARKISEFSLKVLVSAATLGRAVSKLSEPHRRAHGGGQVGHGPP